MALSKIKGTVIADDAINADRIADGTVIASDLLDNTITGAKLATDIAINTSGNITTTGDLTVDTNTLFVDSTNNRVGILTNSPTVALTVAATTSTNFLRVGDGRANNPAIRFDDSDTSNNGEITLDNTSLRIEVDEDNAVASSVIAFRADSSEKMRITSDGNVGIGTSSPNFPLEIYKASTSEVAIGTDNGGTAQLSFWENNSSTKEFFVKYDGFNNNGVIGTSGSSNAIVIARDTGNVGIGTSSPSVNLHISSTEPKILLQSTAGSPTYAPVIATNGSAKLYGNQGRESSTGTFSSNHFLTEWDDANGYALSHRWYTGASSERMRIDSNGNVGINISNPQTKLHVGALIGSGSLNGYTKACIEGTDYAILTLKSPNANFSQILFTDTTAANLGVISYYNSSNASSNAMAFSTNNAERMRITSSGNVGIGTSSPGYLLQISASDPVLSLYSNGSNRNTHIYMGDSTDADAGRISYDIAQDTMYLITNDTERIRMDSSGNVRIAGAGVQDTSNPGWSFIYTGGNQKSELEHVSGNSGGLIARWRTTSGVAGSITTSGTSTTYATSSDYRVKENVNYDFDATTRLKQLKPARFNFISDTNKTVDGFLAHEVQSVVPEAIVGEKDAMTTEPYVITPAVLDEEGNVITEAVMGTREVPDLQGIDQSKLVPLLVKTIQELEARITALEANNP